MTWPEYLRRECRYKGWPTALTPQEAEVLLVMLLRSPEATTADVLIDALWGDDPDGGPSTAESDIRIFIGRLRAKLPGVIGGRRGFGWHLQGSSSRGCRARRLAHRKEKNHDRSTQQRQIDGTAQRAANL
jgi:hypothetical protein